MRQPNAMELFLRRDPVLAAGRVVANRVALLEDLRSTAEGFATLDFVQGRISAEPPADVAQLIAELLSDELMCEHASVIELVDMWLESYHRAYACIVQRALDDGEASPAD